MSHPAIHLLAGEIPWTIRSLTEALQRVFEEYVVPVGCRIIAFFDQGDNSFSHVFHLQRNQIPAMEVMCAAMDGPIFLQEEKLNCVIIFFGDQTYQLIERFDREDVV